jgi:hypothetical protein
MISEQLPARADGGSGAAAHIDALRERVAQQRKKARRGQRVMREGFS